MFKRTFAIGAQIIENINLIWISPKSYSLNESKL